TAGNVVGAHEATIAYHYEQAHRYRFELGALDDATRGLGNHAADLLRTAAERALDSDDLAAAGSLARRALACVDDNDRMRPAILLLACEALASSDIPAARSTIAELSTVVPNERLVAWTTCFESQLTVMTDPTGLVEAAAACATAALSLAELGDHAGVAKARQIRAGALARLGRVGDCEIELDLALTSARAAEDRRRVTAVLGAAPLAALWGPSTVPRAGGRCLDVIRLLRITAGSPAVEAVSVRCQAVLEALRGRFDAARAMLETSRRTAEELGLRPSLMKTELYAGIVKLLAGEPAEAETHLRLAHAGLGRLGIGADAGQATAHLARSLLLQGKLDEAAQLAVEADENAGQNLQTAIAAKSVRSEIFAAQGHHDEAVAHGRQAVAIAEGTELIVDHASAVAAFARVLHTAGRDDDAYAAALAANRLWHAKGALVDQGGYPTQPSHDPATIGPARDAGSERDDARPESSVDERSALAAQSSQARRFLALEESGTFDLDRYVPMLAPDLVRDDRRDASGTSMGVGGRDAFIAGVEAMRAIGGNYARFTPLAADRARLLLARGVADYGDGNETPFIVLLRWNDDGLIDLIAIYGDDEREGAEAELARLASLDAASLRSDSASGVAGSRSHLELSSPMMVACARIVDAYEARDIDVVARTISPNLTTDDRRAGIRVESDREHSLAAITDLLEHPVELTLTLSPVATRGDRLALFDATLEPPFGAPPSSQRFSDSTTRDSSPASSTWNPMTARRPSRSSTDSTPRTLLDSRSLTEPQT
ncbi:MAG: tetratricopeptide (TPR) repeat protein, partial [Acidimicrobiales bacterium]